LTYSAIVVLVFAPLVLAILLLAVGSARHGSGHTQR